MSKNRINRGNHQENSSGYQHNSYSAHAAEYRIIRSDLIRLIVLNVIYLGAILALYYTNNQHHYLERWFEKLF